MPHKWSCNRSYHIGSQLVNLAVEEVRLEISPVSVKFLLAGEQVRVCAPSIVSEWVRKHLKLVSVSWRRCKVAGSADSSK